jgi:hypothetical protein
MCGADDFFRRFTAEQLAMNELGCDEKPDIEEVFDHYGEKITFGELATRFREKGAK